MAERSLLQRIHNPANYECGCDPDCWCRRTTIGRAVKWWFPARFFRIRHKNSFYSFYDDEPWWDETSESRAALSAAVYALNETGEMFMMATAQGKDVESLREYYPVRLEALINRAIATLAIVNNETLSKVLEDVRETVGHDHIFRRNIEAQIEEFRRQEDVRKRLGRCRYGGIAGFRWLEARRSRGKS